MLSSSLLTCFLPNGKLVNVYNLVWINCGAGWPVAKQQLVKGTSTIIPVDFSIKSYVPEMFCINYVWTRCLIGLSSRKIKIDNKITKWFRWCRAALNISVGSDVVGRVFAKSDSRTPPSPCHHPPSRPRKRGLPFMHVMRLIFWLNQTKYYEASILNTK